MLNRLRTHERSHCLISELVRTQIRNQSGFDLEEGRKGWENIKILTKLRSHQLPGDQMHSPHWTIRYHRNICNLETGPFSLG